MATLYYRPQALETIARHILTRYDEMYLNGKPRAVPIETIIEKTFGLRIEYQYLTNDLPQERSRAEEAEKHSGQCVKSTCRSRCLDTD